MATEDTSRHRLQIDASLSTIRDIDELKVDIGVGTRAETIREGLKALSMLAAMRKGAAFVATLDKDGNVLEKIPIKAFFPTALRVLHF